MRLLKIGFFIMIFFTSLACNATEKYTLVAPNCLLKNVRNLFILAQQNHLSLIQINEPEFNRLVEAKKSPACGGFFNVTEEWQNTHSLSAGQFLKKFNSQSSLTQAKEKYSIRYPKTVNHLLTLFNPQNLWDKLVILSSFQDRYSRSDNGVKAAQWLEDQVKEIAKANGRTDVTTSKIATGSNYSQPSVVIKIGNSSKPGVVIGAHMDTLNGARTPMPGADDDGSGSTTVLELARVLLTSQVQFDKPIYLIWYAAEEMGLVGSQAVVKQFKSQGIPVAAVFNMDMSGYLYQNDDSVWLVNDNTNPTLTAFLKTLTDTYVKKPVKNMSCGYACSDHASWTKAGYIAAAPFESPMYKYDPYIHTSNDKITFLSLNHMANIAKLSIAFAVEMAEPLKN